MFCGFIMVTYTNLTVNGCFVQKHQFSACYLKRADVCATSMICSVAGWYPWLTPLSKMVLRWQFTDKSTHNTYLYEQRLDYWQETRLNKSHNSSFCGLPQNIKVYKVSTHYTVFIHTTLYSYTCFIVCVQCFCTVV